MWKLNTSMVFVAVLIMKMIQGLHALSISMSPQAFEEDLSFKLEKPMDKCENIEKHQINLTNMGLEVVKKHFIVSDEVVAVNLENNNIFEIVSNAFDAVPNLECLNIGRNKANYIFDGFLRSFSHNKLRLLNLAGVRSKFTSDRFDLYSNTTLNTTIGSLPSVTHLDISGNNLINLPDYLESLFPNLTHLYLSDNNLNPSYFYLIPKTTKHLYIERNNRSIDLKDLPKNITALFLNENVIVNPEEFQNFTKLEILSVRMCQHIHLIIISLSASIKELDISSNKLKSLGPVNFLKNYTNLKRLCVDHNTMFMLLITPSLTHLSSAYNQIFFLTEDIVDHTLNLRILNLKGNNIERISPQLFHKLPVLTKLDLSRNMLDSLTPKWMDKTELRYVNLEFNHFTNIDHMFISKNFTSLEHLFIGNNYFLWFSLDTLMKLPSNLVIHSTTLSTCTCN